MASLFSIGMAAGGFAQGAQQAVQTYAIAKTAEQRQQLIELEKQKQNVQTYTTLRDALNTMDPDTFTSMTPTWAKIMGGDASDPQFKSMIGQMADNQTQLGKAARTVLNSAGFADTAKTLPPSALAKMAQDPAAINSFIKSAQDIKLQQQALTLGQNAVNAANGNMSNTQPSTQAPAPNGGTPIPQPQTPNAAPDGGVGGSGGGTQAPPPNATPATTAPAPISSLPGRSAPVQSVIGASGSSVASAVSNLRSQALQFSLNPYLKDRATVMQDQADKMENNFYRGQEVNTGFYKAQTERLDKTYKEAETLPDGSKLYKSALGDPKIVAANPAMKDYWTQRAQDSAKQYADINQKAEQAQVGLGQVAQLRALSSGTDKTMPPMGTFEGVQEWAGTLFNSIGLPGLAQGITKSAPTAEATNAILASAAAPMAEQMKSMNIPSRVISLIHDQLPQLANTPEGRNLIMDSMEHAYKQASEVQKIWSDHEKSGTPVYVPDKNGQTAEDKSIKYLASQATVPQAVQKTLDVMEGRRPVTTTGEIIKNGSRGATGSWQEPQVTLQATDKKAYDNLSAGTPYKIQGDPNVYHKGR